MKSNQLFTVDTLLYPTILNTEKSMSNSRNLSKIKPRRFDEFSSPGGWSKDPTGAELNDQKIIAKNGFSIKQLPVERK